VQYIHTGDTTGGEGQSNRGEYQRGGAVHKQDRTPVEREVHTNKGDCWWRGALHTQIRDTTGGEGL